MSVDIGGEWIFDDEEGLVRGKAKEDKLRGGEWGCKFDTRVGSLDFEW